MPAITTIHESLPYIDPEPTPEQRAAADALIQAERSLVPDDPDHALLPPPANPAFTPAMAGELERVAAQQPLTGGIDLSRYEAADSALPGTASASEAASALRRAYASAAYLRGRRAHLALLDAHGRNAWLVGNAALEAELRALERELAAARRDVDVLAVRRRRAQEDVAAEVAALADAWRTGVGRVLEAEVAAEALRREVLEARRKAAA